MKTMCQVLIVVFVLYFCEQIDTISAEMKRSITNGQGVGLLFGRTLGLCDLYTDLSSRQRDICRNSVLMGSIIEGARLARKECSDQFRKEKWDCSSIPDSPMTVLGLMSKYATKEAAFNYALVTAGIVQILARNCMKGDFQPTCHCSRAQRPTALNAKYSWGGCGDNIQFGISFSKTFLDDPQMGKLNGSSNSKRAAKLLMDHHNREVGREAVLKNRRIICKCHGATSHCTAKTCWYQVQEFKVIGDYLKKKYISAEKVILHKRKDRKIVLKDQNNKLSKNKLIHELVYTENSPDYCTTTSQDNYYSDDGLERSCNATVTGPGSCDYLCCGRGYKDDSETVSKKCRCKFHWCCDVKCEECEENKTIHKCKV